MGSVPVREITKKIDELRNLYVLIEEGIGVKKQIN